MVPRIYSQNKMVKLLSWNNHLRKFYLKKEFKIFLLVLFSNLLINSIEAQVLFEMCPLDVVTTTSGDGTGDCTTTVSGIGMTWVARPPDNSTAGQFNTTSNLAGSIEYQLTGATTTVGFVFGDAGTENFEVGVTNVVYRLEDPNDIGNYAFCGFTVTVTDDEIPAITCPANITMNVTAGTCGKVITYTAPVGTDNCTGQSTAQIAGIGSGATFPVGTTTETYRVTDAAGLMADCSFTVTVIDNENPAITCPANITMNVTAGTCGRVITYTAPVGTDNCTGQSTAQIAGIGSGATFPVGTTTETYRVTDAAGLMADCSFTVTVIDNETPAITCPANITMNVTAGTCGRVITYTAPVGTDNCTGQSTAQIAGLGSGATFPVGTTTETYRVTDAAGLMADCSFTVTVIDNETPAITCPANITMNVTAGTCGRVITYTAPVGTDNCTGQSTAQIAGLGSGATFPVGTTTETYRVTDAAGLMADCSFTITVVDNENPTITCPADISINVDAGTCGAVVTYTPPVGTDNCPGATTAQTAGFGSGAIFPIGTTTETYLVTDAAGNTTTCSFDITVVDNENPTITCPANITMNVDSGICGAVVNYTAPVGIDNCPGASTARIAGAASGATFPVGTTTVTHEVTDDSGLTATCSFDIIVTDNENPTITCPANINVNVDAGTCGAVVTFTPPVGTDNCPGATTARTAGFVSGATFPVGTTTQTYVVTDAIGLTATCSFDIIVTDNENPTITCPANINVNVDAGTCGAVVTFTPPVGTDNCLGATTARTAGLTSGVSFPVGTTTQTYVVTDAAGNTATCSFNIIVTDNENPAITCPANINVNVDAGTCGAVVTYTPPVGTDNCPGATTALTGGLVSGVTFPVGTTTQTYVVTDAAGNTATCSFDIIVTDNENPTIVCPANITMNVDTGICGAVVNYTAPVGIDNCPGATTALTGGLASGVSFPVGTTTQTYVVTDAAGNTATCSFDIIVTDNELPVFVTPPLSTSVQCIADVPAPTNLAWNDNCDGTGSVMSTDASLSGGACGGTISRTWSYTDAAGNTGTASQIITVHDNTPPTASDPAPMMVQCFPAADPSVVTNAADNCTTTPTVLHVGDVSNTNNTCDEIITRTYRVTDDCGNFFDVTQIITIKDDVIPAGTPPPSVGGVISSLANAIDSVQLYYPFDSAMVALGYSDNCSTIDENSISLTSTLSTGTDCNWDVIYTYNVTDDCGNTLGSQIWVISGSDNTITPDVASLPTLNIDCDDSVTAPTASSCTTAVIYGTPNAGTQVGATNSYNNFPSGATTVTWTYDDGVGTPVTQTQTIDVTDMTSPVISSCPTGDFDIYLNSMGEATLSGAAYNTYLSDLLANSTDNCGGTLTTYTDGQTSYTCADAGTTISLSVWVYDGVNYSSPCSITVNVIDDFGPTFENVPADIFAECDTLGLVPNADPAVVAKDSCGIVGNVVFNELSLQLSDPSLPGHYNYEIIRTWTATDVNGNQETATQSIFVQDTEYPVFTNITNDTTLNIPANQNNCQASISIQMTAADVFDNCTDFSNLIITNNSFYANNNGADASGVYPTGTYGFNYRVEDPSGNVSFFSVEVNVTDDTPPVASCSNNVAVAIPAGQDSVIINPMLVNNFSFDNCYTGMDVQLDVSPGVFYCSQIADGTQEEFDITLIVSTPDGDTSYCVTTIIIQDNTAPVVNCIDNLVITLGADGTATATTDMLNEGIDDCSDIMTIELTGNTAYNLTDIGIHTDTLIPTLQVTDIHGNVGTCTPLSVFVTPPTTCIESQNVVSEGQVAIPYTSSNFTNVIGFQFSVEVDENSVAAFTMGNMANLCGAVTLNVPNLSGIHQDLICNGTFTNQLSVTGDTLSISWFNTSTDPISIPDGEALFNVNIDALGVVGDSTFFSITGAPYSTELTTKYGNNIITDNPTLCHNLGYFKVGNNATLPITGNVSTWSRTRIDTMSIDTNFMVIPNTYTYNLDTVVLIAGQGLANASLVKIEEMLPLISNTPDTTDTDMTDGNGDFTVQVANVTNGVAIDLVPRKNNPNWLNNGDVNSSDLFFIQQHIVNNIPFTSIYDYVAADVNQSGTITTLDLVLIQDVIVNPEISPIPSSVIDAYSPWRFIQKEYAESDLDPFDLDPSITLPAQPMAPVIPAAEQNRVYNPAVLPMANIDWIAVKVGQIFGGLNTSTLTTIDVDSRTGENFVMSVENQKVTNGESISIPVYAKDYAAFIAWQFTLEFDENYLAYEGILSGAIEGFEENKLGLNSLEEGIIGAVWYGIPNTVKSDEVLFTLQFTALDDADALSGLIDVTSRTVTSQSSLMSGATGEVSLTFFSPIAVATSDFKLHQNRPNPFNGETLISFNLPEAGFATMTISDISGRTLKVIESDFAKGYNEVRIQSNDLSSTGVLYYQLESAEHIATKKMIILE
jgi:hypothetical protein